MPRIKCVIKEVSHGKAIYSVFSLERENGESVWSTFEEDIKPHHFPNLPLIERTAIDLQNYQDAVRAVPTHYIFELEEYERALERLASKSNRVDVIKRAIVRACSLYVEIDEVMWDEPLEKMAEEVYRSLYDKSNNQGEE